MKLYAVSMMKDEDDIADHVIYHLALQGVDGIIVADNMSTDLTLTKLKEAKDNIESSFDIDVQITFDRETAYTQSEKMTQLGHKAASRGATWILPFDADELWYGVEGTIKDAISRADKLGLQYLQAAYWNHRVTTEDTPGNPFVGMGYRESDYTGFYKVAYKYNNYIKVSNGNHFITPTDIVPDRTTIVMRHFPIRSEEQFIKKISNGYHACRALAKDHDLYNGAGWSPYFPAYESDGVDGLRKMYNESYRGTQGFVYDPAPFVSWEKV